MKRSDNKDDIRKSVRERYAGIATGAQSGCGCTPSCCSPKAPAASGQSAKLGYSKQDLEAVPEGADMGLGCGNPQAIAMLKKGEVVLDLGAGGGFDCFLAAKQVGPRGRVIGVDMTPEMVAKARENARQGGFRNVEFRLGEIEHLPVADASVDVILSNCVINLSPDKEQVYQEAFRVLKPGGRLAISDVVAIKPVPKAVREDFDKHSGCVAGALHVRQLERMLLDAGFRDGRVLVNEQSKAFIKDWFPGNGVEAYVRSADVQAVKPKHDSGDKIKILFLCTGNSCRSQMAEGWARALKGDVLEAWSAGIETHGLNPNAVKVMAEAGVDISSHQSKTTAAVRDVPFDYVVTVCGHANETCPMWLGAKAKVVHVGFDDPPALARTAKTEAEALAHYRRVRDEIRAFVERLPDHLDTSPSNG